MKMLYQSQQTVCQLCLLSGCTVESRGVGKFVPLGQGPNSFTQFLTVAKVKAAQAVPFQLRPYLEFFLVGGSLPRLGVYSFLQVIEPNGKNWNQARRPSNQWGTN